VDFTLSLIFVSIELELVVSDLDLRGLSMVMGFACLILVLSREYIFWLNVVLSKSIGVV
jgi:hypothetical protein